MDLFDVCWNYSQDKAIKELAQNVKVLGKDAAWIKHLQEENADLRLRLSLLIRLLIERGVFTAEDYSTLVEGTEAKLAVAKKAEIRRAAHVRRTGAATRRPVSH